MVNAPNMYRMCESRVVQTLSPRKEEVTGFNPGSVSHVPFRHPSLWSLRSLCSLDVYSVSSASDETLAMMLGLRRCRNRGLAGRHYAVKMMEICHNAGIVWLGSASLWQLDFPWKNIKTSGTPLVSLQLNQASTQNIWYKILASHTK